MCSLAVVLRSPRRPQNDGTSHHLSALLNFLVLFCNCFFSASTCFDSSVSSCFATCAALAAVYAALCAVPSTLPTAEPIFTATFLSLFFLAIGIPPGNGQ